jgi:hypothetical protein
MVHIAAAFSEAQKNAILLPVEPWRHVIAQYNISQRRAK